SKRAISRPRMCAPFRARRMSRCFWTPRGNRGRARISSPRPGSRIPDQRTSIHMLDRFAADAVLLLHFAFIVFVVFGALLVVRWRALMPLHAAAVSWAVYVELTGGICPLT